MSHPRILVTKGEVIIISQSSKISMSHPRILVTKGEVIIIAQYFTIFKLANYFP